MQAYVCVDAKLQGLLVEEYMCQELGLQRECVETNPCLCLCYTVTAEGTSVEAAYFEEPGCELQLYSPFIYYLHLHGSLSKTTGSSNSAAYNYFSANHTELTISRDNCQGTHVHDNPHRVPFDYSNWRPAPHKDHFENDDLKFQKLLVIVTSMLKNGMSHQSTS